ncbi:sensory neuron membrane protein 2-like isoform X1 [Pieris brassicae]|uniref:Sensory neuron membrane protein 2 n=2 Tax=Pieris brassicae TaxID=7116 RepID=A0A9P0TSG4_PIEBR|nr:sensory neuron membrane protein 2-like isoform X1 [Pieris brassicae]CAH4036586.1 unnamed protein product [Pieris brassicae]
MLGKNAKMLFGLSICALIISVLLAAWGFPSILKRQIQKSVQLDNDSMMFEKWRKIPFPLFFKIHVFNVTNVDAIMDGKKPVLQEVGPFVYKEYRERTILGYGENDTIKYTMKKSFVYDQEASGSLSEEEEVTVINFSYMNAILTAHDLMPGIMPMLNDAMSGFFSTDGTPFIKIKAKDLFFDGMFLNCSLSQSAIALICGKIKADTPQVMRPAKEENGFYFSLFDHLNRTESGPYEMVRGTQNINELGHIVSYQDKQSMEQWMDNYCGMINGSDGSIYPPINENNVPSRLYYFEPQICRSIYVSVVGQRAFLNMSTYYFEVDSSMLASKSANPDNKCFCKRNWSSNHDGCLLMGTFNVMPCQGAPAIISLPHFYLASDELLDYFGGGISPDRELHTSFLYIEPTTGAMLSGMQRIQFNVELRNIPNVPQLATVKSGLFPLLWLEEGVDKLPDDIVKDLRDAHTTIGYVEAARWLIVVIAAFMCVGSAVCVVRSGAVAVWPRTNNFVLNAGNHLDINKGRN